MCPKNIIIIGLENVIELKDNTDKTNFQTLNDSKKHTLKTQPETIDLSRVGFPRNI